MPISYRLVGPWTMHPSNKSSNQTPLNLMTSIDDEQDPPDGDMDENTLHYQMAVPQPHTLHHSSQLMINSFVPYPFPDPGISVGYNPQISLHTFQPFYPSQSKSMHFEPMDTSTDPFHNSNEVSFHSVFGFGSPKSSDYNRNNDKTNTNAILNASAFQRVPAHAEIRDRPPPEIIDKLPQEMQGNIHSGVLSARQTQFRSELQTARPEFPSEMQTSRAEFPSEMQTNRVDLQKGSDSGEQSPTRTDHRNESQSTEKLIHPMDPSRVIGNPTALSQGHSVMTKEQKSRVSMQIQRLIQTLIQINSVGKSKVRSRALQSSHKASTDMLQAFVVYEQNQLSTNGSSVVSSPLLHAWTELHRSNYINEHEPCVEELPALFGQYFEADFCLSERLKNPKVLKKCLNKKRRRFSEAEDHLLGMGVVEYGRNVLRSDVASKVQKRFLPARTLKEVKNRYKNLQRRNPELVQGFLHKIQAKQWTDQELNQLRRCYTLHGNSLQKALQYVKAHPEDIKKQFAEWTEDRRREGFLEYEGSSYNEDDDPDYEYQSTSSMGSAEYISSAVQWTHERDLEILTAFQRSGTFNVAEWGGMSRLFEGISNNLIQKRLSHIIDTVCADDSFAESVLWTDERDLEILKCFQSCGSFQVHEWGELPESLQHISANLIQNRLQFIINTVQQ